MPPNKRATVVRGVCAVMNVRAGQSHEHQLQTASFLILIQTNLLLRALCLVNVQ